jgi:DNA repair exonuclease SbcCD ATPase subunit
MNEPETFLNRIGRMFRRSAKPGGNGGTSTLTEGDGHASSSVSVEAHPVTLRPWKKNTAAIAQLQDGFNSLTDLMGDIRQNMVSQGRRQDELIGHLAALPKLLESIPENNRIQGETLKAIHAQILHHGEQQQTLGEILERLAESGTDQKDLLEGLRERVETLNHQDKAMADSLSSVSVSLESSSKASAVSAQVLENLRDNLRARDGEVEKLLKRQGTRFTVLLSIAIVVAVIALASAAVMAFLLMHGGLK